MGGIIAHIKRVGYYSLLNYVEGEHEVSGSGDVSSVPYSSLFRPNFTILVYTLYGIKAKFTDSITSEKIYKTVRSVVTKGKAGIILKKSAFQFQLRIIEFSSDT